MKKLLIVVAALVVLVVVALVAAPFLIPVDRIKQEVQTAALEATGRELKIAGDFKLSLIPRLELQADQVSFANAPWASAPTMAAIERLLVRLEIMPLLSGEVRVASFVLEKPEINLEVAEDGRANFQFETVTEQAADKPAEAPATGEAGAPPTDAISEISFGDVRLSGGRVSYRDAASGEVIEISDINLALKLPSLDAPFAADGSLVWNGEKIDLDLSAPSLRPFLAGQESPLKLAIKSSPVSFGFDGALATLPAAKAGGAIELDVPSLRGLAAWTGNPIEDEGRGLGPLKIAGKVAYEGTRFSFSEAQIAIDNIKATGALAADTGGAKPALEGRLDIERLDLNDYLPPPAEGEAAQTTGDQGADGPPPEWSDEKIDLSGLHSVNADFALTLGSLQVREIKVGKSALVMALKDGRLKLDLTELALYDGKGVASITVDARGKVPAITESFKLTGVQAQPLLTDAAAFERLSGTGNIEIQVSTKGDSQRAMVEALAGNGAINFNDGAIQGINLASMVRNVATAFTADQSAQKTDFSELAATFNITRGIVSNQDLRLVSPLMRVTGAGTADLPARRVDYRVTPKAVASLEGQGGAADVAGVAVPVIVEGPWHDITYRPDLAGLVEDIAKDPAKAVEGAKDVVKKIKEGGTKEGLGKLLEGVTGGSGGDSGGDSGDGGQAPDVGGALKKLFGQ
jgi:AsmA protein